MKAIKNIYYFQQKISFQSLVTKENQNYLNELFLFLSRLPFFRFSRVGVPCYKKIIGSL
jgi:hypothetical protein